MNSSSDDARQAEKGIRDLMGLLSLSTSWLGKDGRSVLITMIEAVERIIPLRFLLAESSILVGEAPTFMGHVDNVVLDCHEAQLWREVAQTWPRTNTLSSLSEIERPTPLGIMRVARLELGLGTSAGTVWFGSDREGFPSMTQLAVLRAATSLGATGLQAARTHHEREEASRLKDEFLAMLGHELRNPLAPIRSAASLLQLKGISVEHIQRASAVIERQVQHMTSLLDDLLDVSRVSTGAIVIENSEVDMHKVIAVACEQTQPLFIGKGHRLTRNLQPGLALVYGDKTRLIQVTANLLSNAARYTPVGGQISIELELTATHIVVRVADNGIGIDSTMLPKICDLFVQARQSIERSDGGLGVGLALAKRLVELHGGRLLAQSKGLGFGSTFTVELPLMSAHAPVVSATPPGDSAVFLPLKIFVVDDNVDGAETMADMLTALGHHVLVSHSPTDALTRAEGWQPDAFILDIGLPEMDGYELARRLMQIPNLGHARFIALTGYGQPSDRQRADEAGFHHHCVKPIDLPTLIRIFNQIVAEQA